MQKLFGRQGLSYQNLRFRHGQRAIRERLLQSRRNYAIAGTMDGLGVGIFGKLQIQLFYTFYNARYTFIYNLQVKGTTYSKY